jgi:hypothetical protein
MCHRHEPAESSRHVHMLFSLKLTINAFSTARYVLEVLCSFQISQLEFYIIYLISSTWANFPQPVISLISSRMQHLSVIQITKIHVMCFPILVPLVEISSKILTYSHVPVQVT